MLGRRDALRKALTLEREKGREQGNHSVFGGTRPAPELSSISD